MVKTGLVWCAIACAAASGMAWAQMGPMQIEATARKVTEVPSYTDADGKKRAKPIPIASLQFPIRALEETPTGMARIATAGGDAWVALEDFKVNRDVKADCNFVMTTTTTGASRGANEGCAGTKKK